jgi:hypothetical protein
MDEAPNWTLCLQIVGIVVTMAFVPLLPLAGWKFEQWRKAQRERNAVSDPAGQRADADHETPGR